MTQTKEQKEYRRQYYLTHKEKQKEYNRTPKRKLYHANYRATHKEEKKAWDKTPKAKAYANTYQRRHRLTHKDENKAYQTQYRAMHKQEKREQRKGYDKQYIMNRYHNDSLYRFKACLSSRLRKFIDKEGQTTSKILGYGAIELKDCLESQFQKGMTLQNHGRISNENKVVWNIDHKHPLSFAKSREEVIALFALDNLQPMWAKDNLQKGDKVIADLFNIDFDKLKEFTV